MKSAGAILKKVLRDHIQGLVTAGTLPNALDCQVTDGPQPTSFGIMFVAIHNARHKNAAPEGAAYDRQIWSVDVTISMMSTHVPRDRILEGVDTITDAMDLIGQIIAQSISHNYTILATANATIDPARS